MFSLFPNPKLFISLSIIHSIHVPVKCLHNLYAVHLSFPSCHIIHGIAAAIQYDNIIMYKMALKIGQKNYLNVLLLESSHKLNFLALRRCNLQSRVTYLPENMGWAEVKGWWIPYFLCTWHRDMLLPLVVQLLNYSPGTFRLCSSYFLHALLLRVLCPPKVERSGQTFCRNFCY